MSKPLNIAIVGATGNVGSELLRGLEARAFPIESLRLLASERSAGDFLEFQGEGVLVEVLDRDSFRDIDLALFCATEEVSREFCPLAVAAGAVCVDISCAWRMDPQVPLVVPEVNPEALAGFRAQGIVANPNASTIQLVTALKPLHDVARIRRIVVIACQAVSGSGRQAMEELRVQSGDLLNGRPAESQVYPHPIAFNCLPQVGSFLENGDTRDEMKIVDETRKILGDDTIGVTATAVRVPVFYGHSEAVNIETERKLTVARARELLGNAPGVELRDDFAAGVYPMPVDAAGQDLILVGRLREDHSIANGLNLWICADNLRKGTAVNAVQIAELLMEKYL